jgi:hypothetical protein
MVSFLVAAAVVADVSLARAQAPTGDISGRLTSSDGLPLPGVTVQVTSPSAPGSRSVTTSENGDYLIALLPPGTYTVTFSIEGFQTLQRTINVAGTQDARLDATMSPAGVTATVDVVGQAQPFVETAQVATNFKQQLMAALPSNRTIDAVLLMAPAVHPTGPRGAYTINGAQSYENLWILNGAVINENLRGLPMTPYIEDAIQEVTVASAGVSAEYGRFAGGVATAVTKSGGDSFSGSLRTTFANDSWRSFTPFETTDLILNAQRKPSELKLNATVPTYEATVGGPLQRGELWFFGAMRSQVQKSKRTTTATNIPYTFTNDEQRYEGKLTYTPTAGHSVQGSYFNLSQILHNNAQFTVGDIQSLTRQGQPQSLMAVQYTGVLKPNFSLSAQYSERRLTFTEVGSNATDRINGTLMLDLSRNNLRYWSPTFCSGSACKDGDEERNNQNIVVKGSYFLSDHALGTHQVVFGYDYFNDNIIANTHASGSEYRIRGTSSIIGPGQTIYPTLMPNLNTTLDYNPLVGLSEGSNLRVHSLFLNDSWRQSERLTFNLGVRLDKNDATDGDHHNVGNDLSFSPRLSATWDPRGDGRWAVSGSLARYTMALTSNLAGSTAKGGNSATYRWLYTGPAINPPGTPVESLVPTAEAIARVFEWHESLGGNSRKASATTIPGVNMKLLEPLTSPYSMEYSGGVSRALGRRGTLRTDLVYRNFRNFYGLRTDLQTSTVSDPVGGTFDLNVVENTDRTERQYVGLTTQASYDLPQVSMGGNYTLSRAWGDVEGESVNTGPSGGTTNNYPEYRVESWNYPVGDLNIDQRHRARLWATYNLPIAPASGLMSVALLQQFASGVPYAAIGFINPTPFMTNPGYLTPPAALEYYFLGRNPFHTEATYRTDLALNYGYRLGRIGDSRPELFFHGELLNVFNQFQLCACGENVFRNGGISDLTTIAQGVQVLAPFNPYSSQPVERTHWQTASNFGQAANRFAFTTPRTFRFSAGVRF